jgi:2-oxoisovalerate dehydrogenase E1 component beta subunit
MTTEATWFASAIAEDVAAPGVTYLEALRSGLADLLAEDERVLLLGEDIGVMGGAFRVTAGLQERFGTSRVIDTPMSETAILGCAIGLALGGLRPIVELQFADFISCCYDQLVNEAAKLHWRFGIAVPIVVRCPSGGGLGAGPFHSQCPEGIFAHVPGLKVICPATVQDAYGLLRAALADPDPVLVFEQKALYRSQKAQLDRAAAVPVIGRAAVRRPGRHLSVVTYGAMLPRCLDAAEQLQGEGIEAEVIDLVSLVPLDIDTVAASAARTGRLAVVHEDTSSSGIGAEVIARLAESDVLYCLDAPVCRVTAPDTPVPSSPVLEDRYVPSTGRILAALRRLAGA